MCQPKPPRADYPNPWQTLQRQEVYRNPWIRVYDDQALNPAQKPCQYGVVEFANQAVAIVPVDTEGYTWLVGQHRYPLDCYSWEVPMGGCPQGEQPLTAAKRELQEETGLQAKQWQPILQQLQVSNSVTNELGHIYLAQQLTLGATAFEESEDISVLRCPLTQALHWALSGHIQDALSVLALLSVHHHLHTPSQV